MVYCVVINWLLTVNLCVTQPREIHTTVCLLHHRYCPQPIAVAQLLIQQSLTVAVDVREQTLLCGNSQFWKWTEGYKEKTQWFLSPFLAKSKRLFHSGEDIQSLLTASPICHAMLFNTNSIEQLWYPHHKHCDRVSSQGPIPCASPK